MKFLFYVVLLCANICFAQQTDIIWANPVRVTINGNSITKSQNGQKASAKSENILDANTNGWAEFKVTETGVRLGFGFIKSTSNNNEVDGEIDFANMDYSIQLFNNNSIKIYKEGDLFGQFGSYTAGSIFRIERLNNQIKFYKNNVLLTTITNNGIPSKSFVVNGVIQSNGSSITLAKSSFVKPLTMTSSVTDVHCQSATNLGSISISVSGGLQPYTYLWSNGATTASLNSIKSGIYSLVLTDASSKTISQTFTVLNCVDWTDGTGVSINSTVLTKTVATLWGNSGAASENVLAGGSDGYMQFKPSGNAKFSAIGLTYLNTDNDYLSIDYAFLIDHKRLFIFSSGKLQGDFGRLKNSDILKIERKAETILYYKNDIVIFKEPTKPDMDLVVDVAFNKMNDYFENVKSTFFSKPSLTGIVKNYDNDLAKGSVELILKGGYAPYNFAWNDVKVPSNQEVFSRLKTYTDFAFDSILISSNLDSLRRKNKWLDLLPGNYPITIFDQLNDSKKTVGVVGTKIDWLYLKNTSTASLDIPTRNIEKTLYLFDKGENISQNGEFVFGKNYVVSENNFTKDFDNYLEFSIPDIRDVVYVGLIEKQKDIKDGFEDLRQKTYFEFVGKEFFRIWFVDSYIFESKYSTGDVFAFATDSKTGDFIFYLNGKEVSRKKMESLKPENNLLVKVLLGSPSARVSNMVMRTLPMPIIGLSRANFVINVTDVRCNNPCAGVADITASVNAPIDPSKFEILDEFGTIINTVNLTVLPAHAVIPDLCAGKYTVKYYFERYFPFPSSAVATKTFDIAYMPEWTNMAANTTTMTPDNTLIKTGGTSSFFQWHDGASSVNVLNSLDKGWIEWTTGGPLPLLFETYGIGFSKTDVDVNLNTTKYGMGMVDFWNFRFYVFTNNERIIDVANSTVHFFGLYAQSSVFRLEKDQSAGLLKLYINGAPIAGATFGLSAAEDLIADASLQFSGSKIRHPRLSFGCPYVQEFAIPEKKLDGGYYTIHEQKLLFKYNEEYKDTDSKLKFNIYNEANTIVYSSVSMASSAPSVIYGDNRYSINLANSAYYVPGQTMPNNKFYILEIINEKNEKWYLRFKK